MMYGESNVKDRILTFIKTGLNREPMRKNIFPEMDDFADPFAKLVDLRLCIRAYTLASLLWTHW